MGIIRSQTCAGQASALAHASAERARALATEASERLRAEGRAEAERAAAVRIAAAERRAAEAEQRAEQRVAQAKADAQERLGRAAEGLERALASLSSLERRLIAESEAACLDLALAIAGRVLEREVASDRAWMRDLFRAALAESPDRRAVTVRCAPADAAALRDLSPAAVAATATERLVVEDDPALAPGSLVIACGGTRIDASVASSWERIARAAFAAAQRPPLAMRDDGSEPQP
jgi:flagellar assembly protein FliH